ncbi:PTS system, glucose-specific IIABC component [Mycoplasmopsis californica]|nr:PTS system, glucose-specific IIABC component [Mycoplasmopsis californica]
MIEPDGDEVTLYAPISGVISAINETNHALIISNKNVSVLLHIGTQTTQLQGQGIDLLVKQNQKVRKRQALLKLNLAYLQSHLDFAGIIMVVIPESKRHRLSQIKYGKIQKKQLIFKASK